MSADSPDNDQPAIGGPADGVSPVGGPGGAWSADPIRSTRSIGPLSSFASLRSQRRSRRPFIIAGITVVGLLGGAGAALATTGSATSIAAPGEVAATPAPAPTPTPSPAAGVPHRFFGHNFAGAGSGMAGGLSGALHGQLVVAKPGGGYQTVDIQNGKVTAVSATTITLKSADGYARSYDVTSSTIVDAQRDGIGSVKVGNRASVLATISGSTATAVTVRDLTLLQQGRKAFGYPGRRTGTSWSSVS
jgi:hypothetical protein